MVRQIRRHNGTEWRWTSVLVTVWCGIVLGQSSPTVEPKPQEAPQNETATDSDVDQPRDAVPVVTEPAEFVKQADADAIAKAISSSQDWVWVSQISQLLATDEHRSLLEADEVIAALASRLGEAPADARRSLLTAMSLVSSPDAVRGVMQLVGSDADFEASSEAMKALIKQTGRADLGANPQAWRDWWAQQEWIPEAQWLRRVARWQAAYARTLAQSLDTSARRQAELLRALYGVTKAEDRPALLIRMLSDPFAPNRLLGLELASRAIVNATKLPPSVIEQAGTLLLDSSAEVRTASAKLLASSGLNGQASAVSRSLAQEQSPQAAQAMLQALVYADPTRSDVASAARWIKDQTAGPAAASLLLTALDHEGFTQQELRQRVYRAVQEDMGVSLKADGVRLFGRLAGSKDFGRLTNLLTDHDGAIRDAAAQSLAQRAEGIGPLLEATTENPELLRFAIAGLSRFRVDRNGWAWLSEAPGVTSEALESFADLLTSDEAIEAARSEPSAEKRLTLLKRFDPKSLNTQSEQGLNQIRIMREGRGARLRTLLDLNQFDQVVKEARIAPETIDADARRSTFRVALLCLGKTEDASNGKATAQEWLDAVSRLAKVDQSKAIALAQAGVRSYSRVFTSAQIDWLNSLTTHLVESSADSGKDDAEAPNPTGIAPVTPSEGHDTDIESLES